VSAGVGGPPLFVELCAGTAALSLRLHRDGARPPVSRMGAKTGYADVILRVLGLIPGQRADRYLWCEPDPGVGSCSTPTALPRWRRPPPPSSAGGPPKTRARCGSGCAPRGRRDCRMARWTRARWRGGLLSADGACALATRRRATPAPMSGPSRRRRPSRRPVTVRRPSPPPSPPTPGTSTPARWRAGRRSRRANRLIHTAWSDAEGRWVNTGDGGATFGGDAFCSPPSAPPRASTRRPATCPRWSCPTPARWTRARWRGGHRRGVAERRAHMGPDRPSSCHPPGWTASITAEGLARRADALPAIDGALIHPDAREVDPREVARWAFVQSCNTMIALDSDWRNTGAGGSITVAPGRRPV
jgi:hypothetical protein